MGGRRGQARPGPGEDVRPRPHRAAHALVGTVAVGDESFEITDGLGLGDHSWGPRYWQNIRWYRWLTGNLGPDLGFAVTISGDEADGRRVHGFLYDRERIGDDGWVPIRDATLRSEYDDEWFPLENRITVTTADHTYAVAGDVWSNIPLHNRREGMVT